MTTCHGSPDNHTMNDTAESLIAYCRENGRVCPLPMRWNELWQMLPDHRRAGGGWEPAAPLILAAWHEASNVAKMLRLAGHIGWADQHGNLSEVAEFLRNLGETDWHHLGE